MSFLDCNGALIPYAYEAWRDEGRDKQSKRVSLLILLLLVFLFFFQREFYTDYCFFFHPSFPLSFNLCNRTRTIFIRMPLYSVFKIRFDILTRCLADTNERSVYLLSISYCLLKKFGSPTLAV